jgi:hypothetical protein
MPKMLKSLQEWICDTCGEVIASPNDGWVEWKESKGKRHHFRIVHNLRHTRYAATGGTCQYSRQERDGDLYLSEMVGKVGLVRLMSWIDVGEWHQDEYAGPGVFSLREWTILVRRLHLPYYEEARLCTEELTDFRSGGANEILFYVPEQLKRIVEAHEAHTTTA